MTAQDGVFIWASKPKLLYGAPRNKPLCLFNLKILGLNTQTLLVINVTNYANPVLIELTMREAFQLDDAQHISKQLTKNCL